MEFACDSGDRHRTYRLPDLQRSRRIRSVQTPTVKSPNMGLVTKRPSTGRFVAVDAGFMVPYTARIPGTDATYKMEPIPGGRYRLGPNNIEIEVKPFWMGKYEVTWLEFKRYMSLNETFKEFQKKRLRVITAANHLDGVSAPSMLYDPALTFMGDGDKHPAASMTQYTARQYTKWLSGISGRYYRLPTEAEWEYACRAGTSTRFYFGKNNRDYRVHSWIKPNSDEIRHPVGQLLPNPWGLHDMSGNVSEWVLDGYTELDPIDRKKLPWLASIPIKQVDLKNSPPVVKGASAVSPLDAVRFDYRLKADYVSWKEEDPNFPTSPWWLNSHEGLFVGFRLVRPYDIPASRESREASWQGDSKTLEEIKFRVQEMGRGAFGVVDEKLPEDIAKMKKILDAQKNAFEIEDDSTIAHLPRQFKKFKLQNWSEW